MKSLNEKRAVKYTFLLFDLFKKIFPLFIISYIGSLYLSTTMPNKFKISLYDYFRIFRNNNAMLNSNDSLLMIVIILINIIFLISIYFVLIRLTSFTKNVFENKPFIEENGRYLKQVGIIAAILTIIFHLSTILINPAMDQLPLSKLLLLITKAFFVLSIVFNPYLILSLFIYALGEIIIHAARLKQENDLTI
ncbi:MAG: DUF2975 domain-containing protein [Ignavibacteriaceae bacterium]|nr:DUF2975 domain-containing protein [Ignavibacteriaceae bacterium]